ncbi:pectate lyase superfamily protein-domain-containing protein [Leptodontidium sp. 2 PMI_412]|nr:pectate lyase superfamily protein-domain-containing protein [Leptodontidium sp. 2 PMI_412]
MCANHEFYSQPTRAHTVRQVIDLDPEFVYLVYNCFYMRDICKNADNYFRTGRGQIHPESGLPSYVFGYDFNTGKNSHFRSTQRRDQSCPGNWKDVHVCPEPDQRVVMRNDGPWHHNDLEPGTTKNEIRHLRGPNNQIMAQSNLIFTCDEFPAATWVQGGNGEDGTTPSQTRCAAFRCAKGYKAEQNWQATAHGALRRALNDYIKKRIKTDPTQFKDFKINEDVVLFGFVRINVPDGNAAQIWSYDNLATSALAPIDGIKYITQAKKRFEGAVNGTSHRWPAEVDVEKLQALIKSGQGSRFIVPANDSLHSWSNSTDTTFRLPTMNGLENQFLWNFADDDHDSRDTDEVANIGREREKPVDIIEHPSVLRRKFGPTVHAITPLIKNATAKDVSDARLIVKNAIAESSKLNKARLAKPLRNLYGSRRGPMLGGSRIVVSNGSIATQLEQGLPPLLQITDRIAAAAALVAEADADVAFGNVTKRAVAATGTYWMGSLSRKGTVPWGNDPSYKVFRNVLDYGAVGDGITDDTKAITRAMSNGTRCGEKCNGSTTKNAIVYFPPGTYLISTTIAMPFGTQVIGDVKNRPRLLAAKSFIGLGVLSTDEYTGGNGGAEQYYINTANFYRQIRNIIIDITQAQGKQISCLHYQVAQATSLQNVELVAAAGASSDQIGMYAENGSGGQISDVTFTGGAIGLYGGNQQFTAQRLTFVGCAIGVHVIWDWGWVWKSITMTNVKVGFKLVSEDGSGNIGSASFLDSSFNNVGTAILIAPPSSKPATGSTGVILENVKLSGVTTAVADTAGKTLLGGSSTGLVVDHWVLGPVYEGSTTSRSFSSGAKVGNYRRHPTLIDAKGSYFERAKPQYEDRPLSDFLHVKDMGAVGDGVTDDTEAVQKALYASIGKVLFIDAGSYILTSTVMIPPGVKIVGETWSQLVASGAFFEDAAKPKALLKVGNPGDVGDVEMQDLLFTTRGATAGLILVQWNIKAANPGSAGLWDCHARIGGATGTKLTPAECPPVFTGIDKACSAGSLMMHLTSSGSGYFENMWLWGADHMLDDPDLASPSNDMIQTSVYIARGFLIESTHATWLYATASEHAIFYQYNFHGAKNIFAGMLQTESPYFQPSPPPPAPFAAAIGVFAGDPDYKCIASNAFSGCDESWSTIITKSANIFIAGAGLYSWFSSYSQSCIDTQACQKALLLLDSNFANVRIQNLITIGAKYMAVMNGKGISALENLNVATHPEWSQISVLDVTSSGAQFSDLIWIDPSIWKMDKPQFTCVPPCYVKLPPWTGATSTLDYPLVTVSDGTWTSTVTQPPLTISQWVFEVVTITQANSNNMEKRQQNLDQIWPILAATPNWPGFMYEGLDGLSTTTVPNMAYPTPPPFAPDTPPPTGSWPASGVMPILGTIDQPITDECSYFDFNCDQFYPLVFDPSGLSVSLQDFDDVGENGDDDLITCPLTETSSSSTTRTTRTTSKATESTTATISVEIPEPSPLEHGKTEDNKKKCHNSGMKTSHLRLDNAASSFCKDIAKDVLKAPYKRTMRYEQPGGNTAIMVSLKILKECEWPYNYDQCKKYLAVPVDSCNCQGYDSKQGGTVSNNCYTWRMDPEYIP